MDSREQGFVLFKKGLKYKEIAEKLGVSESTVKSWASRYWKTGKTGKGATKKVAKVATSDATAEAPKQKGGQPGNVNSVRNNGGAPSGNQNAATHGGYAKLLYNSLSDEETAYYEGDGEQDDEEEMLLRDIRLLDIRIARLMSQIKSFQDGEILYVDSVSTYEDKRRFESLEDKELHDRMIRDQIQSGDRLPGTPYRVSTTTKSAAEFILSVQEALNRAQAQKQRCLDTLIKLREARKADNPNTDIEDLRDLRKAVFGDFPKQNP